ncbi:response regulator [Trichlorobacter lovleyi]|uniref:Response regulator receiver protein n=1 Tax=Trichlorobacter lovleyi (strain ATCC BAA-1151 / DSM 17278 / SZ) TaxID=398767 RepID=B3E9L0_TRIL1|nr:response regulator [Trichlorobacter lovleyi]ACD95286.1 response regulator receiver protein [Trichlorobacter lovleyi SZ]QOX78580.1 response regulator [Trichlorobacter lovleyi]
MSDTILLVDDEPSVLSAITRALRGEPYEVVSELSGELALERMAAQPFKVVLSDERMARMQGSEFLAIARSRYPGTVRILLTGHATLDAAIRAVNDGGIYKFLTKPWQDNDLKQAIRDALLKHDTEQEAWRLFGLLQQQHDMDDLEKLHPGISRLERDQEGNLMLPELSDDALNDLRRQCEKAFLDLDPASDSASDPADMVRGMFLHGIRN